MGGVPGEAWRVPGIAPGVRVAVSAPAGRVALVPVDDPAEAAHGRNPGQGSGAAVYILYRSASGEVTERAVTVRRISGYHGELEHLEGFCHVRRAYRTFRMDRVQDVLCPATGEVLDPMTHLSELLQMGALKSADKALDAIATVACFMARCDGAIVQPEMAVIEAAIERYARHFPCHDGAMERAIGEIRRFAPEAADLRRALKAISRAPYRAELARFALRTAGEVIDADLVHDPAEVQWGVELSDALFSLTQGG